jgi:hypothetical protein
MLVTKRLHKRFSCRTAAMTRAASDGLKTSQIGSD